LENGKIPDQTIQNNIGLSRYIPKQIKNFSVDGKEKLFRSNDSLPLINTRRWFVRKWSTTILRMYSRA
jgi:hypothetical protein